MKKDLKSLTRKELEEELRLMGEKPYRAKQIYEWIHQKQADSFDGMSSLSKELRKTLARLYKLTIIKPVKTETSKLDGTQKFLFELEDGEAVESVFMKYRHGNSVCISSQAGCRMGCSFCASTINGLERNLTPAEMLDQVYRIQNIVGERISHVVVMGSGEPMDNYDNLIRFIHILTDEEGIHISGRNITVSTCGLVPQIRRFAGEGLSVTLALSLHAPNDSLRRTLMPAAAAWPLYEVLDACEYYFEKSGRRVTMEYSLMHGINDSTAQAEELAALIHRRNFHINLIPVNPVAERDYKEPHRKDIVAFQNVLEKYGINVTIRREMGRDIEGACGQLRKGYMRYRSKSKGGDTCVHMD